MNPDKDMVEAMKLPPKQAIAYFRARGYVMPDERTLLDNSRSHAFTVAEATKLSTVEAYQKELDRALTEGLTQDQFIKNIKSKGYTNIDDVPAYRMQTIFRSNMQSALNEGRRISQVANQDNQPYWMRVEVMDSSTRPSHAAVNGKVYPADDPWWDDNYPPYLAGKFEFGCRGRVIALSEKRLKAMQAKNPLIEVKETNREDEGFDRMASSAYLNDVETAKKLTRIQSDQLREQTIQTFNNSKLRQKQYEDWVNTRSTTRPQNTMQTLGFIDEPTKKALKQQGVVLDPIVGISEKNIGHMRSQKHIADGVEPSIADVANMSRLMATSQEVYWLQSDDKLAYFGHTRADGKTLVLLVGDMRYQKEFGKDMKNDPISRSVTSYFVDKNNFIYDRKGIKIK